MATATVDPQVPKREKRPGGWQRKQLKAEQQAAFLQLVVDRFVALCGNRVLAEILKQIREEQQNGR